MGQLPHIETSLEMHQRRENDKDVKELMRVQEDVELSCRPSLWDPTNIEESPKDVKESHE